MTNPICTNCGKKMVVVGTREVFTTYPCVRRMKWWCACGYEEKAESVRDKTDEQRNLEEFNRINNLQPNEPNQVNNNK